MEKSDADIVREIVTQALGFGIEMSSLVELLEAQNSNGVNANLANAELQNPLISIRNALMTRLVLMVAREYSKPRKSDKNLHRAFDLLGEPSVHEIFNNREAALTEATKHFKKCKGDNRLQKITHFRDKYTAHIGEPEEIPSPLYKEVFAFARETITVIDNIAAAVGLADVKIADNIDAKEEAEAFWKPWATPAPDNPNGGAG
jgi:hypothetical protein